MEHWNTGLPLLDERLNTGICKGKKMGMNALTVAVALPLAFLKNKKSCSAWGFLCVLFFFFLDKF